MKKFILLFGLALSLSAQSLKYNPFTGKFDYVSVGAGSGDISGASNSGTGSSIFYQKSGNTLQFNGVKSANNGISVTLDTGTHDVTLTFNPGNVTLTSLSGDLAQSRITNLVSDLSTKDAVLTFSSPLSRTSNTIAIPAASSGVPGHLSAADWNTFTNLRVPTSRTISTDSTLTGGGDLSANRTLGVVNDTSQQRVAVLDGGSAVGTRQTINFIEGSNVTLTIADNAGGNRVDVTVASTGSGSSTTEGYCVPSIVSSNLQISTPCKVLNNNVEITFGSNITFDATSGTGDAFFGIHQGVAKVWHNVTASCTNATCVTSPAVPPADACVLVSAPVSSGVVGTPVNTRLGRSCATISSGNTTVATVDPTSGSATIEVTTAPNVYFGVDAGANDTYVVTASPAPGAYVAGTLYCFDANTANTGAATINFNSLGAKTIKKMSGSITADLADNDILPGQHVCGIYDGTNMQMTSQIANAAAGSPAFSAITTGTNTSATMTVGAGASVEPTSTGTVKATTQSQVFTADGTYTPGPGVTRVLVKVLGGGGGGNAGGFGASGNGGGGGAYVEKICEVTPGSGVTVTVGDGGAGASGSDNGVQAESSSFGTCAVALGGMGGQRSASRSGIGGLDDDVPPIYFFYARGTAGSALSATPTFATYSDFSNASNLGAFTSAGNCSQTETSFVPFHHSAGGIGGQSKTTNDGTGCPGNRGLMGAGGGGGGGRGTGNAGGAGGTSGNPFAGSGAAGGTHGAVGNNASANSGGGGGGGGDDGATFRTGGNGGSGKVEVIVI